jgi:hypothetical protein
VGEDAIQKLLVRLETNYSEEYYWNKKDYKTIVDKYPHGKYAAESKSIMTTEESSRLEEEKAKKKKREVERFGKEIFKEDGRFVAFIDDTVLDKTTNLMWAAQDNGSDINWPDAKSYCENYRVGGYTDWRMPTQDELVNLYDSGKNYKTQRAYDVHLTEFIKLSSCCLWGSEIRGSAATYFRFDVGKRVWSPQSQGAIGYRALPLRSNK